MKPLSNIIISRTDSIGDVVLTLPLARVLKTYFPDITIAFLGREYTRAVVAACAAVDIFIEKEAFLRDGALINGKKPEAILHVFPVAAIAYKAKSTGIPLRIGTTNRLYHWFTCNRLTALSRKNSPLHEAQLNLRLLHSLGINRDFSTEEIGRLYDMTHIPTPDAGIQALIDPDRFNLIFHPRSQGSAREWGTDNFLKLIRLASPEKFKLFITGTEKDQESLRDFLKLAGRQVTDLTGTMPLSQLIAFIQQADGLVANSTGPLHIAAALGKYALGIYPPIRPMHPGRWAPLGIQAQYLVAGSPCGKCQKDPAACTCMQTISPEAVLQRLEDAYNKLKTGHTTP